MPPRPPVPRILALFPGHGSQWPGMGRSLLDGSRAFREAIAACDERVRARLGWAVQDELRRSAEASQLGDIVVLQVVLFAVEVALAALWEERGVVPGAAMGTSLGEIPAAYVAGALSFDDCVELVIARAEIVEALRPDGGAVVVNVSEADAAPLLQGLEDEASVSGLNGPVTTSFSGTTRAMDEILRRAAARDVFAARIRVEYPAHCTLLGPLADPLRERLGTLRPGPTRIPFYSTVNGDVMKGESLDTEYWVANLLAPVRASPTIVRALTDGWNVVLEMTPHPIFRKPVEDAIAYAGVDAAHCATLRRETEAAACLDSAEARLRERGVACPGATR